MTDSGIISIPIVVKAIRAYETSVPSKKDRTEGETYRKEHMKEDKLTKQTEKKQPESQEEIQVSTMSHESREGIDLRRRRK